jgi:hypothetical protein
MEPISRRRVLIVANRTAATPELVEAVRERADRGLCEFTLLVPCLAEEELFGEEEAHRTLARATPMLAEAAGGEVSGLVGPADALLAIEHALVHEHFDEVILSTCRDRVSHWLKRDLPRRVERLGVPVRVVRAMTARRPMHEPVGFGL